MSLIFRIRKFRTWAHKILCFGNVFQILCFPWQELFGGHFPCFPVQWGPRQVAPPPPPANLLSTCHNTNTTNELSSFLIQTLSLAAIRLQVIFWQITRQRSNSSGFDSTCLYIFCGFPILRPALGNDTIWPYKRGGRWWGVNQMGQIKRLFEIIVAK